MKHHTPNQPSKFRIVFFQHPAHHVEGLGLVFYWLCLYCWRMPLHYATAGFDCCCGICAEPHHLQFDQQFFITELLRGLTILTYSMCLALVTFLPTVLTKLLGTTCLEIWTGSVRNISLQLIGVMLALSLVPSQRGGKTFV